MDLIQRSAAIKETGAIAVSADSRNTDETVVPEHHAEIGESPVLIGAGGWIRCTKCPTQAFPRFSGIPLDDDRQLSKISGARVLDNTTAFPGPNPTVYAISRRSTQRNLNRISLP